MRADLRLALVALVVAAPVAFARPPAKPAPLVDAPPPPPAAPTVPVEQGLAAFAGVASVLQHPRCQNCHPAGDVPLQTDASVPHNMGITRDSPRVGLDCSTCHREVGIDAPNLPPANAHWRMPPAVEVFQGHTPASLCAQLKDPARTGGRDLPTLLHHVENDALVLYGWAPGGGRSVPPITHEAFVAAFGTWIDAGAPGPAG
jgi:hypothetical protein